MEQGIEKEVLRTSALPHPHLFQASDIRGVYGETLFDHDAYHIGFQLAQMLVNTKTQPWVTVVRDHRPSSEPLFHKLTLGLTEGGVNVYDLGIGPTPLATHGMNVLQALGAVMITASHNPAHHNGFKITLFNQGTLRGNQLQQLQEPLPLCKTASHGQVQTLSLLGSYVDTLLAGRSLKEKNLKIIWDIGNGVCGEPVRRLMGHIHGYHRVVFATPDANFPNHHPDPSRPENMQHLQKLMSQEKGDLGFSFDADGDRVGMIDEAGNVWFGEDLFFLISDLLLKNNPGACFVADVKVTDYLESWIKERGGSLIWSRTGHGFIKEAIQKNEAIFGGEYSGHLYFNDGYGGVDDGLYAAIRIIEWAMQSDVSLSSFYASLPKRFALREELIHFSDHGVKIQKMKTIKTILENEKVPFSDLDGVRVTRPYGWWLIRPSNTIPALTLRAEGMTARDLDTLKSEMEEYLNHA